MVCHEANRAYCASIGDTSQLPWSEAAEWQRQSAIKGVEFAITNPHALASAQHDAWLEDKRKDGWTYGPVKDSEKKEHPCFVPYDVLPVEQQLKDALFKVVVGALTSHHHTHPKAEESAISKIKRWRRDLDAILQEMKEESMKPICLVDEWNARSQALHRLTEAIMWHGMTLKAIGTPNPYPNSKDPSNQIVEPTADGLKL